MAVRGHLVLSCSPGHDRRTLKPGECCEMQGAGRRAVLQSMHYLPARGSGELVPRMRHCAECNSYFRLSVNPAPSLDNEVIGMAEPTLREATVLEHSRPPGDARVMSSAESGTKSARRRSLSGQETANCWDDSTRLSVSTLPRTGGTWPCLWRRCPVEVTFRSLSNARMFALSKRPSHCQSGSLRILQDLARLATERLVC